MTVRHATPLEHPPLTAKQDISRISHVFRLSDSCVFCCGELQYMLSGKEAIAIDGVPAKRPYLAARLTVSRPSRTLMILRTEDDSVLNAFNSITLTHAKGTVNWQFGRLIEDDERKYRELAASLTEEDLSKSLFLLMRFSAIEPQIMQEKNYIQLCMDLRKQLQPVEAPVQNAFWLSPSVLYMETVLPKDTYQTPRLVYGSGQTIFAARAELLPSSGGISADGTQVYRLLAVFGNQTRDAIGNGFLTLVFKDKLMPVQRVGVPEEEQLTPFIAYINRKQETERLYIRDFLNRSIMENAGEDMHDNAVELIRSLQLSIEVKPGATCKTSTPFGFEVETLFPVGDKGVFISGWIYDPLKLAGEITVYTDMGTVLPLDGHVQYYQRDDLQARYSDTAFGRGYRPSGFVAFVPYQPQEMERLVRWPGMISGYARITMKSGQHFILAPDQVAYSPYAALETLLTRTAESLPVYGTAVETVACTAAELQKLCSQDLSVASEMVYGTQPAIPKVSVIIPLCASSDQIAAQLAHFANDAFMKRVEVIFVLGVVEQEASIRERLQALHDVYKFPFRLLVLSRHAGYTAAANVAVEYGASSTILLMDARILPKKYGWLEKMLAFYRNQREKVTIAPKLLHADDSICHAGMHFSANAHTGTFDYVSYYKGYPSGYPGADTSRAVPSVSAMCLLFNRELFDSAGRFAGDYIEDGFEDADLCLRLWQRECVHHYLADVEMYYLEPEPGVEKQLPAYRYWLNALLHHQRWNHVIEEIVKDHG